MSTYPNNTIIDYSRQQCNYSIIHRVYKYIIYYITLNGLSEAQLLNLNCSFIDYLSPNVLHVPERDIK